MVKRRRRRGSQSSWNLEFLLRPCPTGLPGVRPWTKGRVETRVRPPYLTLTFPPARTDPPTRTSIYTCVGPSTCVSGQNLREVDVDGTSSRTPKPTTHDYGEESGRVWDREELMSTGLIRVRDGYPRSDPGPLVTGSGRDPSTTISPIEQGVPLVSHRKTNLPLRYKRSK